MKLNHLNLTVSDVPEAAQFMEKYFGLKRTEIGGDSSHIAQLRDDDETGSHLHGGR